MANFAVIYHIVPLCVYVYAPVCCLPLDVYKIQLKGKTKRSQFADPFEGYFIIMLGAKS